MGSETLAPDARAAPVPPPASAARRRKVGVVHFAFMRSIVQGLDLRASWERYLAVEGSPADPRLVRSTIAWIRDEFAAAAKKHDRFGTARLVRLDAAKIPTPSVTLPSLEAFAQDKGLEDESEADQIAAYEAEHGSANVRQQRRSKLILRQLEALKWLETLIAQPPRAGDSVAAWLHPSLADRLEAADLFTLAQLVERINGIGRHWYASVKALGAAKARRIVAWLREHEGSTGLPLGRHIDVRRSSLYAHELSAVVQPASDIRPLEKFIVPTELDGRQGVYRRPQAQCLLKASNDYQAILAWLRSKHGLTPEQKQQLKARRQQRDLGVEQGIELGLDWLQALSNTQRAYRKEAERFLLWAIVHRGKALSSMTNEDCTLYRDFLADPQPTSRWCGDRSRARWSPLWRPFEGPLSASAQRQAVGILKNLYGFLVDQNYLMGNPWSAVAVPRNAGPKLNAGRSLTRAQWAFVQQQLALLGDASVQQRLKFGLHLLYATGLRLSEVVAAKVDDLVWVEYAADASDDQALEGWMLRVVGKGQKIREVPVPIEVVSMLAGYLEDRGLDPDPEYIGNRSAHLLGKATDAAKRAPGLLGVGEFGEIDPFEGVAGTTLYRQVKRFFGDCADVLRGQGDVKGAERFERASTHWMRHSHASHAIAAGMPIEIAQQNLGHASLATTTVYVTTESKRRLRAVEKFWAR